MATSNIALVVNIAACGIYGYSAYYLNYNPNLQKMHDMMPQELRVYGQLKFLTFQCLVIQLFSSILHVLAHFIKPLRKLRDLVFTGLAYPMGSVVVYSFWAIWHYMGRENLFPTEISEFYPDWLNHATHTVIGPVNIILMIVLHHRYYRYGVLLCLAHSGFYTLLLIYLKFKTGHYVYIFLEVLSDNERLVYFVGSNIFAYAMYSSGHLLNQLVHSHAGKAPSVKSKQQQKQKQT